MATATDKDRPNYSAASGKPQYVPPAKNPDMDKPLEPELVDLAVAELHYQTAFYLEAIQAMMDGVTLGTEQVQDKRIEFLEVGPTTDIESQVFMFVITLILEGTIGTFLARICIRNTLRPLMLGVARAFEKRSVRYAEKLSPQLQLWLQRLESYGVAKLAKPAGPKRSLMDARAANAREIATTLLKDISGKHKTAETIRIGMNQVIDFAENNLVAFVKGKKAIDDMPGSSSQLEKDNSPGVSVTAAAMTDASRLRLAALAVQESLEVDFRRPGITLGEVVNILDEYRLEAQVDLGVLRETFQLTAEIMVWAKLYISKSKSDAVKMLETPIQPGDRGVPYAGASSMKLGIDEKKVQYLLSRFGKEIERWALKSGVMLLSELKQYGNSNAHPPRPTGFWENLKPHDKEDLLVRYLASVSENLPQEFSLRA